MTSLDPAIAFEAESVGLVRIGFHGLFDYDDDGKLVLDQAKDWSVSPDGRRYVFHLRPDVRFSNGRPVEAADYKAALERVLNPKMGSQGPGYYMAIRGARDYNAGKASSVTGILAPDPLTLVFELDEPQFVFRYELAMLFAAPIPREFASEGREEFVRHSVGSGPYRFVEWKRGVRIRAERNPYYSGGRAWVDRVDVMIGGDTAVASMMLKRGELDRVWSDSIQAKQFAKDPARSSWLKPFSVPNTVYLFLNTELKPFDNVKVRQAMNLAVDKERLLRMGGGYGIAARGIVPPSMPWANPQLPEFKHDPEAARKLLREAGYPDGFRSELVCETQTPGLVRMAEALQDDFRQIGVQMDLKLMTITAMVARSGARRQVPAGLSYWYADYPDPSNFLDVLLNGTRITDADCLNLSFYSSAAVTRDLQAADRATVPEERAAFYRLAEARAVADAPWVPLMHAQHLFLRHPRLRGDINNPVLGWRYEGMWLAE